jgi:hypothetical protein
VPSRDRKTEQLGTLLADRSAESGSARGNERVYFRVHLKEPILGFHETSLDVTNLSESSSSCLIDADPAKTGDTSTSFLISMTRTWRTRPPFHVVQPVIDARMNVQSGEWQLVDLDVVGVI